MKRKLTVFNQSVNTVERHFSFDELLKCGYYSKKLTLKQFLKKASGFGTDNFQLLKWGHIFINKKV